MTKKTKPLRSMVDIYEHREIERALQIGKGNVAKTARDLQMTRRNLWRKIEKYGIKVERFRA